MNHSGLRQRSRRPLKLIIQLARVLIGLVAGTAPALALTVDQVVSTNGVRAWPVEDHSILLIVVRFAFVAGAAQDPKGRACQHCVGPAHGGRQRSLCRSIQGAAFRALGARLSLSSVRDAVCGGLETLSGRLGPSAELLKLALISPRVDPEAVDRVRAQRLTDLALAANIPSGVALHRWYVDAVKPDTAWGSVILTACVW